MRNSLYLVTGGAGFIGSHIVEYLISGGYAVRVLDNFTTGKRENLFSVIDRIELIEGDIRDYETLMRALDGVNCIFHQAAVTSVSRSWDDPIYTFDVNSMGTLKLIIAASKSGVKKIIYASSSSVYGDTPILPKNEDMQPKPISPYALSKLMGEQKLGLFAESAGINVIVLRYFNVYGPKQDESSPYSAVIPKFIDAILRKKPPVIYGDGEQTRDFTYVDDVVKANILAMECKQDGCFVMNIGTGISTSINELFKKICEITGNYVIPDFKPPREGDVRHSMASIERAEKIIGYKPETSLEEGLRETIEYFKKRIIKKT